MEYRDASQLQPKPPQPKRESAPRPRITPNRERIVWAVAKKLGMDPHQLLTRLEREFGIKLPVTSKSALNEEQHAAVLAAFRAHNRLPPKRGRGRPRRSAT